MPFESLDPTSGHLAGTINVQLLDPDGIAPATIIEKDNKFLVRVNWSISGLIAPALGGDWHVKAFLDDVDGGPFEGQIGATANVPLSVAPPALTRNYSTTITVVAGKVPVGLYKLMVAITYSNLNVVLEMAAFQEGPLLQVYNPGPIETF